MRNESASTTGPPVIRQVNDVAIVDLSKAVGSASKAVPLSAEVERLVAQGHRCILVDLANVRFVDSAMLGDLLAAKKAVIMAGAQLKLLRPRKQASGLLAQTKLENVFECFEDEQIAIRSFTPPS